MFTLFIEEILRGEGQAGVVLIDRQSLLLTVWTDHWGKYTSEVLTTAQSIEELKSALEATGFLVVVVEHVLLPAPGKMKCAFRCQSTHRYN